MIDENTGLQILNAHRDLLFSWTVRVIRARYQQSVLGVLWAILQPAAQVLVFSVIFTQFIPINTGDTSYLLFSSVAMVPWTFFNNSLNDMVNSLIENMSLVTKIYFPREILPIAAFLARFIDFLIAGVMLALLLLFFGQEIDLVSLMYLPLIVLIQFALTVGIGLFGAALNVFYRDIKHVITLGLQLWMYASPVFYPVTEVQRAPEWLQNLYFLNPMAGIISSYRDVLLDQRLPGDYLLISAVIAGIVVIFGYWFFKRVEFQFADVV